MRLLLGRFARRFAVASRSVDSARGILVNPVAAFVFFLWLPWPPALRRCSFHIGGLSFLCRHEDWLTADETALRGENNFLGALLADKKRPLVLDLGANIGVFSLKVFTINRQATVHALEPGLRTFEVLEQNRALHPELDWRPARFAIWTEDGCVGFQESRAASTTSHVRASGGTSTVPAMRLRTLLAQMGEAPVDLMKMDIEGAEECVIEDTIDLLGRVDALVVEVHPVRSDPAKVTSLLSRSFQYLYTLDRRQTSKPIIIASRVPRDIASLGARLLQD